MENELLTLRQLARRLQVSQAWLKAEAEAGRIPSLPAGGRYLFSLAAVQNALLERAETRREVPHAE
jgi:hypothetical protein